MFRGMFVCFDALKKNWKTSCKPVIGLDGCFQKRIVQRKVLVAVERDAMEKLFSITWGVVSKENKVN